MSAQQKDENALKIARSHNHVPWCEDYEKMISGMLYDATTGILSNSRYETRVKTLEFNQYQLEKLGQEVLAGNRQSMLENLLGKVGRNVFVEPPFTCDYGCNVSIGDGFFANFNTVILDSGLVQIGDRVLFGPNVSIYAASHETSIASRRKGVELGLPVNIGDDCWIGGNATILGGVTIGNGCTIGAGSVVTRDVPAYSVAVGSPARVIKKVLTPEEENNVDVSQP